MNVSVIIPVYNGEAYIAEAIYSALRQPETGEVIVVDDGSTDQSADICRKIAEREKRVRVITHADGANHGVSAARNLGIEHAAAEYVSFLDADDFYLPNRFALAGRVFQQDATVEGVCEAIGVHFESKEAKEAWRRYGYPLMTTIRAGIATDQIFESQSPIGRSGHCSLDGLTLKRDALWRMAPFDPELTMGEDTAFFVKLAACASLRLGKVDTPVAMRRLHCRNTIMQPRSPSRIWRERLAMWLSVYRWFRRHHCGDARRALVVRRMLEEALTMAPPPDNPFQRAFRFVLRCVGAAMRCPILIWDADFLRFAVKQTVRCLGIGK